MCRFPTGSFPCSVCREPTIGDQANRPGFDRRIAFAFDSGSRIFRDALVLLDVNLKIPDLWQQEAVRSLNQGLDVVVDAPTGAGETYIFEFLRETCQFFTVSFDARSRTTVLMLV